MDSGSMDYDLTPGHGVPDYTWFLLAFGLLLIPPVLYTVRARGFEAQRWMQPVDYLCLRHLIRRRRRLNALCWIRTINCSC